MGKSPPSPSSQPAELRSQLEVLYLRRRLIERAIRSMERYLQLGQKTKARSRQAA